MCFLSIVKKETKNNLLLSSDKDYLFVMLRFLLIYVNVDCIRGLISK